MDGVGPVRGSAGPALWEAAARLLRGETVSWSAVGTGEAAFLAFAREQDLVPLVDRALRHLGGGAGWPQRLVASLRQEALAAAARELAFQREVARVLEALAAFEVRPVLLKGTALAYQVYPDPWLRPRTDTDLFIRRQDRDAVPEALRSLGYAPAVQCDGELVFRQFECQRQDAAGLIHAFDFHWGLSTQTLFAELFSYAELQDRAVPIAGLGPQALGCGATDALLLALLHPVMHHRNEERLLWTYDVHLLASRLQPAELSGLVERARAKGIAAIAAAGLARSQRRFGTAIPGWVFEELARVPPDQQPTARYLDPHRGWADEALANLRHLPGLGARLRLLREIAFPAPGYLLRTYGLPATATGKALLPALYLHRGLRGAFRLLAGRK